MSQAKYVFVGLLLVLDLLILHIGFNYHWFITRRLAILYGVIKRKAVIVHGNCSCRELLEAICVEVICVEVNLIVLIN